MPYIKKENRKKFEKTIEKIVDLSTNPENGNISVGELNYVISSIIWRIFQRTPSYTNGNNLMGVLECVKHEFYRRQLAIYEDVKMQENGDI